ncbi:MAG: hypothetical protein HFI09_04240 [Bacilli bacterium]|nr:hypothetical protein [Bacilli bacterium]
MYICVMAVFTTVVTYSKYISNMGTDEQARVANFEVGINFESCSTIDDSQTNLDGTSVSICDMGSSRPTSVLPYYFSLDTTKLEADAVLSLTVYANDLFKIVELQNLTTGVKYIDNGKILNNIPGVSVAPYGYTSDGYTFTTVTQDVVAKQGKEKYVIKIQYLNPPTNVINEDDIPLEDIFSNTQEVIKIGYSATQKTK